jgi:inosine-uridine nucleoside N-ribohydrolase
VRKRPVIRWICVVAISSLVAVACGGATHDRPSSADALHVVVDADMGTDDVMALLYLLERPDVVVDAITVVGDGLSHCDAGVRNARALLALEGESETPVACGGRTPLAGSNAFPEAWRAYSDDLSSISGIPEPGGTPYDGSALDLLHETLGSDTTLLTLGPLTNIAEALRVDPSLGDRVPRVVAMAGAVDVAGNAPNSVAEYNVWIDSLAAKEVAESMSVELVTLDASKFVPATAFFIEVLAQHLETPAARVVHSVLATNEQVETGTYFFWDPLAAVLVVEPGLATWRQERLLITASLDSGAGWVSRWDQGIPTRYAVRADAMGFERAFISTVSGEQVRAVRPTPDLTTTFNGRRCTIDADTLPEGDVVIALENDSSRPVEVIIAGLLRTTYGDVLKGIRPAGSVVREIPQGIVQIALLGAGPHSVAYARASADPGDAGVFCLVPVQEGAARVWPGGSITIVARPSTSGIG